MTHPRLAEHLEKFGYGAYGDGPGDYPMEGIGPEPFVGRGGGGGGHGGGGGRGGGGRGWGRGFGGGGGGGYFGWPGFGYGWPYGYEPWGMGGDWGIGFGGMWGGPFDHGAWSASWPDYSEGFDPAYGPYVEPFSAFPYWMG